MFPGSALILMDRVMANLLEQGYAMLYVRVMGLDEESHTFTDEDDYDGEREIRIWMTLVLYLNHVSQIFIIEKQIWWWTEEDVGNETWHERAASSALHHPTLSPPPKSSIGSYYQPQVPNIPRLRESPIFDMGESYPSLPHPGPSTSCRTTIWHIPQFSTLGYPVAAPVFGQRLTSSGDLVWRN
ncbi:uncharacterized protein EV420DRAFT_1473444 [Desarmillaria tabescens]|uniref:Uncharacterized protein n=1 Tax=Armillaria tabescens TaxID=1929756 RepID=A0AA39NR92_ARMTA|nr:uncharacterized protein EV420DRAFT_1473444 [Desarmillaria tabescens]KAK0470392.1 hypothetical protein EV420DRAFT_1473444 [Desarmillaria tabescens]